MAEIRHTLSAVGNQRVTAAGSTKRSSRSVCTIPALYTRFLRFPGSRRNLEDYHSLRCRCVSRIWLGEAPLIEVTLRRSLNALSSMPNWDAARVTKTALNKRPLVLQRAAMFLRLQRWKMGAVLPG
jgi:hypothetical protein